MVRREARVLIGWRGRIPRPLRRSSKGISFLFVLLVSVVPCRAAGSFKLPSGSSLFVDSREPQPIQKAADDLAEDLRKVFGRPVRIVHDPNEATPTTLWISQEFSLPKGVQKPSGWERLQLQAVRNPWPGSPAVHAVVLTGSDVRGTIYAIYQFSEEFLGVDPLYWWTDHPPQRRSEVSIPENLSETQSPTFRYRGVFINDEDLLTGWKPGIPEEAIISLETWDRVFEAILRLKGNMVIPGTWMFPYERQIKAAGERGLVVTQHHVNVLGLDTYQWPKDKPYSFLNNPEVLEAAWKRSISQYPPGTEIVWSVGYRGHNDYPFWLVDKNAPETASGRAQIIQGAIEKEIEILKQKHPDAQIVVNAWEEAAPFIREGLLKVPSGVTLVWPDNGHGAIQDRGEIAPGQGVYYHTAMLDNRSNHFTESVPLETIRRELGRAARAGATQYLVVNTSNLRPVPMTTRAVMELTWNAKPWMAEQTDESALYLKKWCREEFGAQAAEALENYYRAYFKAPATYGSEPDQRMGDQFYQTFARIILVRLIKGDVDSPIPGGGRTSFHNLSELGAFLEKSCREADARWQRARALADQAKDLIRPAREQFFQAHVLTQVDANLHSNRMLAEIAAATQTASQAERIARVNSAIREGEETMKALGRAEYGKWAGFYTRGDWLLDVPLTINLARAYVQQLEGHGQDESLLIRAQDRGFGYHMITAYQGTQKVQF